MPKDEFDFEDPFELNGVGLVSAEDTTAAMTECFVEDRTPRMSLVKVYATELVAYIVKHNGQRRVA